MSNRNISPRERLISAFGQVMSDKQALEVVDALDGYASEGDLGTPLVFENLTPNYPNELAKVRAERDAAIACAEEALTKMSRTLDSLRSNAVPAQESDPCDEED